MKKIESIHNKTKQNEELPYNTNNILLSENDLKTFFNKNGLNDIAYNNINLYRNAFIHKSYCTLILRVEILIVLRIVFHYKICHMRD